MNFQRIADRLGISPERLEGFIDGVLKRSSWPEPRLYRFDKAVSGIEAGTVIFDSGEIVHGYPKIKRAMMLGPAIRRHFPDLVAVEEKMNGHNVRVVSVGGDIVALTRGGFICPYSTEVARDRIGHEILEDQPELVLCGEMVGPENPYVPKSIYSIDSIDFFLFDLSLKNRRDTLGVHRTHQIAQEYGISCTPLLGEFRADRAPEEVARIVWDLGRRGREGVILKDPDGHVPPIKYTSSQSNCSDLEFAFRYYNDYAGDFLVSRVVREGFQSAEFDTGPEQVRARATRLGESILLSMRDTIIKKMNGEQIVQEVTIRVKRIQTARDFEYHLRRSGMKAIFDMPEPSEDGYIVRITRPVMSTNDKTGAMVEGKLW